MTTTQDITTQLSILSLANSKRQFFERYNSTEPLQNVKKTLDDFSLYQCIGRGAYGQVYVCTDKNKNEGQKNQLKFYALKVQSKSKLFAENQVEHVKSEKKILECVEFNFIVDLNYYFQDSRNIYLVLEYMPGGELFRFLRNRLYFREETSKFYTMQVVLAIEYLHELGIIYRDIKPENILMNSKGYLKLTDFGFAKLLSINDNNRTYTLCGTPEYLAPEIILHRGYGFAVDWWSIGVLIFELLAGHTPFCSSIPKHIYEKILINKYKFPVHFNADTKSLVKKLLEPDVSKRWGNLRRRAEDVKTHRWFTNSNRATWETIYEQSVPLPIEVATHKISETPELQMETKMIAPENDNEELERIKEAFKDF